MPRRRRATRKTIDYLKPDPSVFPDNPSKSTITRYLTKYEIARVIGSRAEDLEHSAEPRIPIRECYGKRAYQIAAEELRRRELQTYIRRHKPDGTFEDVAVTSLLFATR